MTIPTLGTLFSQSLSRNGERTAVVDGDREVTYAELQDQVGRLLAVFDEWGLAPGDGIGLGMTGMTLEFAAVYIACQVAGLWTTELPPHLPVDVVLERIATTHARILIVDDGTSETRGDELRAALQDTLAWIGRGEAPRWSARDLTARQAEVAPREVVAAEPAAHCGIMFTSGSTGKPKPVLIPSRGAGVHAVMVMATLRYPMAPVTIVPVTHQLILQFLFVPTLMLGGTVVTVAHYSSRKVIAAAIRHRARAVFLTTSDIYELAQRDDTGGIEKSLELIFYGGEPMSAARLSSVTEVFGKIFVGAYGQTETLTAAFLHPEDHDPNRPELLEAAGRAITGVRIEVWGDSGPVPVGSHGELVISSPGCMVGYLGMEEATRKTMENGWVRTGDIGYLDTHGYVHVLDRAKFVFRSAGATVYPHLVEQELSRHPDVIRAAVVGVADNEVEHRVCAAVTLKSGARVTIAELAALPIDGLPGGVHDVQIVESLPVTPANKVDREQVRKLFEAARSTGADAVAAST
ncbi:AMP-binding protein [Mycobacterium kyogaense]|uniref:AMP-binding protein n=1 Tax=Mycobacterium kyogaense TaxID=2212479 RepID=UPI0013C46E3B|nr:AMP-binding protein [Mycobacterium kyogaense]